MEILKEKLSLQQPLIEIFDLIQNYFDLSLKERIQ